MSYKTGLDQIKDAPDYLHQRGPIFLERPGVSAGFDSNSAGQEPYLIGGGSLI